MFAAETEIAEGTPQQGNPVLLDRIFGFILSELISAGTVQGRP
jgi:hypothetical protein